MTKLIALHGYTSNGSVMRDQLGALVAELEREVELVFLDAPHECTAESVDALYAIWQVPRAFMRRVPRQRSGPPNAVKGYSPFWGELCPESSAK